LNNEHLENTYILGGGQMKLQDNFGNFHEFNPWPSDAYIDNKTGSPRFVVVWDLKGKGKPVVPRPIPSEKPTTKKARPF